MKKKLLVFLTIFIVSASAFSIDFTLKGGASFGFSDSYTDSVYWESPLKAAGRGCGFYFGMDVSMLSVPGVGVGSYFDISVLFNDSCKYDGMAMSGSGISYTSINLAFGVYYDFVRTNIFSMYVGSGISVGIQIIERGYHVQPINYDYAGVGLNLKIGARFFPLKHFGIELFATDSLEFESSFNNTVIGSYSYNMDNEFSIANFFNFNIAAAIRF